MLSIYKKIKIFVLILSNIIYEFLYHLDFFYFLNFIAKIYLFIINLFPKNNDFLIFYLCKM